MDDLLKRLDTASCNGTVNLYARARDEITALRARLEAVTEERNVQNDLRQIAEDAADDFRARAERAEAALEAANEGLTAAYLAGVADEKARQAKALATARRDAVDALNRAKDALQYAEQWDTVLEVKAAIRALSNEAET